MSQIFPRSANALARSSIILGGVLVAVLGWLTWTLFRSDFVTGANAFVTQPVQFSHAHHVGGMGFDCRYCHTSVEESTTANIPPTKTCINCHSQIWADSPYLEPVRASYRDNRPLEWIRVNDLPDFVYFNHSIHVRKGVGCATCHGPVDRMPLVYQSASLQMEWCLDCHRQPERYLRPREAVFDMTYRPEGDQLEIGARLKAEYEVRGPEQLTNCSICHR